MICPSAEFSFMGEPIIESGTYHFDLIDRFGCDSIYVVTIDYYDQPEVVSRQDTTIRKGSTVKARTLHYQGDGLKFEWYINETKSHGDVRSFEQEFYDEALVRVKVEDEHSCFAEDAFRIKVESDCPESLVSAANIISPNGDGANDYFEIRTSNEVSIELVEVYNRWGEVVFRSNDISRLWDGTFRGESCNPDVYTYYTRAYCSPGNGFTKYGNVTLIK